MVLLQPGLKANRLTLAAEGVHGITSKPVIWILHKMHPNIMVNCFCLLMNTARLHCSSYLCAAAVR